MRTKFVIVALIVLFFGIALYLRIALPYDQVFSGGWVKFTGVDAWYHMRIVDNLAQNFPHLNLFDPYLLYPSGMGTAGGYFFDYLLAGIAWLVGLGSPSQHLVDVVGAYFPAVLGALVVVPVYFIGKELLNRWAGVISAGLIALMPGEFLGRSILGFADYHVAEALFTAVALLFFILAIKAGKDRISFGSLKWAAVAKPLLYSALAGVFLGIYFFTWQGAVLFVLVILAYLVIQSVIDHLRGRRIDYLCFVGTVAFGVALLVSLPASSKLSLLSLLAGVLVPVVLLGLPRLVAGMKRIFYPAALLGFGLAGLAIFHIASPAFLKEAVGYASLFAWPAGTTVMEMRPFLLPFGDFSFVLVWSNFTTGSFLCLISLGILAYLVCKKGDAEKTLLVVWSLVMLAATLAMRRFAYYFAVNVALLSGCLLWWVLEFIIKKAGRNIVTKYTYAFFGMVIVFFLGFFPSIGPAIATASQTPFAPSDAWCESLSWMRESTPDPFGDPDCYYKLYNSQEESPQAAYGVVCWWDTGYWVARIGHRVPASNPGTGQVGEARLFAAQDESSAVGVIEGQFAGARYVVVDHSLATDKFWAVAELGGGSSEDFFGVYYWRKENRLEPVVLFYPEYYRSLVVRLYCFDGMGMGSQGCPVVFYQERVSQDGVSYREITDVRVFDGYGEAEIFVSAQEPGSCKIAGTSPFVSPVPLEALEHFRLVYNSGGSVETDVGQVPEVKIFEYIK